MSPAQVNDAVEAEAESQSQRENLWFWDCPGASAPARPSRITVLVKTGSLRARALSCDIRVEERGWESGWVSPHVADKYSVYREMEDASVIRGPCLQPPLTGLYGCPLRMHPKLSATPEPAPMVGDHPPFPTGAHPHTGLSPLSLTGAHPIPSSFSCQVGRPVLGRLPWAVSPGERLLIRLAIKVGQ